METLHNNFNPFERMTPKISRPFLSVVTRTQGRRPTTLRDVFLAMAAQTCNDFELIVVGHKLDVDAQRIVQGLIDETSETLSHRIRLILVDHGNRTTPLNEGFMQARGDYVSILDDDDLPMAHWVETFKSLAQQDDALGRVLRVVAVKQECDEVETQFADQGVTSVRMISGLIREYPSSFDLFEHLRVNLTPPIALAFPRYAFQDKNIRFDESLTTTEDWDFLMRTAFVCGVVSSPEITCIYRWWVGAESSRSIHSLDEWKENHYRIFDKMDELTIFLSPGSAKTIRAILDQRDQSINKVHELLTRLGEPVNDLSPPGYTAADYAARVELMQLIASTSWRITAVLRAYKLWRNGIPKNEINVAKMTPIQVSIAIRSIRSSRSWAISAPLRKIKSIFLRKL